jgi:hypothetical protein
MEQEQKFFKGDSVIDDDYGIGRVINVEIGENFPVEVEFSSDNSTVFYTTDGRTFFGEEITLKKSNHNWFP